MSAMLAEHSHALPSLRRLGALEPKGGERPTRYVADGVLIVHEQGQKRS